MKSAAQARRAKLRSFAMSHSTVRRGSSTQEIRARADKRSPAPRPRRSERRSRPSPSVLGTANDRRGDELELMTASSPAARKPNARSEKNPKTDLIAVPRERSREQCRDEPLHDRRGAP